MTSAGGFARLDDEPPSDDDLDLTELDPQHARPGPQSSSSRRQTSFGRSSFDFTGRIPLRNLRSGARRRQDEADADDLEGLLEDAEDTIAGSHAAHKLQDSTNGTRTNGAGKRNGSPHPGPRRSNILAFLDFLPFRRRRTSVALPTSENDDIEDEHDPTANREILVGTRQPTRFPANAISNAKYTPWSFLPRTLWNEFKLFFNLYFLLVALSQIIPALRIGYLSTYILPLAFVISVTLGKEAYDDMYRRKRDREANGEPYRVLHLSPSTNSAIPSTQPFEVVKPARDLKVGDVLILSKDQRVPADVVILKSYTQEVSEPAVFETPPLTAPNLRHGLLDISDNNETQPTDNKVDSGSIHRTTFPPTSGGDEAFIRTDQLDGETDWKLRMPSPLSQSLPANQYTRLRLIAPKPDKRVNDFAGTIEMTNATQQGAYDSLEETTVAASGTPRALPLTIDNTAWANTVLASSSTVHAVVVYTGIQTRAALSTSPSRSKNGLLELEINSLTKILCFLTAALSLILVLLERYEKGDQGKRKWYEAFMRFLILFSTIVPISLRVNLDMGKSVYAYLIHRDKGIAGTVVRTSTIPEDLGRIEYLLSDKTGTLTRNEMVLKKVHVGTVSYGGDAMEEVAAYVNQAFPGEMLSAGNLWTPSTATSTLSGTTRSRREIGLRVRDLVLTLALCHNVTPSTDMSEAGNTVTSYQASSPDEIAIVQWTEVMGLKLLRRDRRTITLQYTGDGRVVVQVEILHIFPFTSDSKRMGTIVRFLLTEGTAGSEDGEIFFFQKGADTVMSSIVAANDWLDEETANMAREGLRTLVIGRKQLTKAQYDTFSTTYAEAGLSLDRRDERMAQVVGEHLEHRLELLGVTGVEDKLQPQVKPSLELLRNAGIKIWMLTGDKVETARCVAVSSKLVSRGQPIHTIAGLKRKEAALDALSPLQGRSNAALLIDGQSLGICLRHHRKAFIETAVRLPAVVACRCSPTQKAEIALLIRAYTKKRIACIGDGGNDVSMIQAADVGVGIVGKEGRQASLAADFSITQFAHLTKLLVWHGRNSYKRSAKLAQFVIHRGLIISVCQTVFSIASGFEPIALYRDWLLVGYATVYTMAPVFSLVLDRDVDEGLANLYPELYKELTLGRSLSYRTFFVWVAISIYQGLIIQGGSELLVPSFLRPGEQAVSTSSKGFKQMVAVSYSVLIMNEVVMVACEVTTWHPIMIFSILGTAALYFGTVPALGGYYDLEFMLTPAFWWRFAAILAASLVPVYAGKIIRRTIKPPSYRKVRG